MPSTSTGGAPVEATRIWALGPIDAAHAAQLLDLLPPDERTRASGLRAPLARARFVVARAALRTVVGAALDVPADRVALRVTRSGRPIVGHVAGPQISIAHTAGIVLVAVHPTVAIGVDVEAADRTVSDAVMARSCTLEELDSLAQSDPAHRAAAFLRLWTRKEAVAKADGRGLGMSVGTIDVRSTGPIRLDGDAEQVWVQDLDAGAGYVAAVATVGASTPVELRQVSLPPSFVDDPVAAFTAAVLRTS